MNKIKLKTILKYILRYIEKEYNKRKKNYTYKYVPIDECNVMTRYY